MQHRFFHAQTGKLCQALSVVLAASLCAGHAGAAVPVEDMSTRDAQPPVNEVRAPVPRTPQPVTALSGAAPPDVAAGQNARLFYELQVLQNELQQLRGLVEDQAYEIKRLRDLQRSQYLDIDRRLTEDGRSGSQRPQNASRAASPPVSRVEGPVRDTTEDTSEVVRVPTPVVQTAEVAGNGSTKPPAATESMALAPTEKAAFERAFELMKNQQFEQSIAAYQGVVESFPDGSYAPESRYWLGELYLMSDRLEAARESFASVVEIYPAHQKVPLSLYKLGVVNHRLGATPAALEYLDNVVTRYPDTPAAGLARTYAAELR